MPQSSLPMDLPSARSAIDAPIVCCVCGSRDWWRGIPGTSAYAERYLGVIELHPGPEIATVAWCMACDPILK